MTENTGAGAEPDVEGRPTGRDEVIEAAIQSAQELFAKRNPNQVSVRDIVASAGVSHALVHRYLGSKDEIFRAVLARDRQEAADYWLNDHGPERTTDTFDESLPPGRFVRTVLRAALDGIPLEPAEEVMPHAGRMLDAIEAGAFRKYAGTDTFDPRIVLAVSLAIGSAVAVGEEFFLAQAGLVGEDREWVRSEISRLAMHVVSLGEPHNAH